MTKPLTKRLLVILAAIQISLLCSGCATLGAHRDETARLLKHPEFKAAAKAAPNFTKDALRTITQLEYELETHGK